ncbi:related to protein BZZ1 [Zygosaccharomyces bailii]|nr:related to protein BZZ1 [Zygosaccharomyces bailii]
MSNQLSIGNELNDSFGETHKWVHNNLKWLRDIELFYRERAKLEHEYSERLSALTREYFTKKSNHSVPLSVGDSPAMTPGSVETAAVVAWNEVLTQTELISKDHWALSRDFEGQVANQLSKIHSKMDTTFNQICSFNGEMVEKREKAYHEVNKAKKNYDDACAAMENARNKNTKSPGERNKQKMEERKAEMNIAKNEYLIRINQANRIKDKFYFQDTPEVLDLLQDLNECRVLFLNDIWRTAGSVEKAAGERIAQKLSSAESVINENKPSLATAMFIKHNAKQWNEPKDFHFQPAPLWQDDDTFVISMESDVSDLRIKLAQAEKEYNKYQDLTQDEKARLSALNDKRGSIKSQEGELEGEVFYDVVRAYLNAVAPFTDHETLKLRAEVQIESIQNNVPAEFDLNTDNVDLSKIKKKSGLFSKLKNKTSILSSPVRSPSHLAPIKGRPRKISLFGTNVESSGGEGSANSSSILHTRSSSAVSIDNDSKSINTVDTPSTRVTSTSPNNCNRVLFAFEGREADEVSIKVGDSISIIAGDTGSGWTRVKNDTTYEEGLVPTSYIEINEESSGSVGKAKPPTLPPPRGSNKIPRKLTVQYDYEAQEDNEMTVEAGETVNVVSEDDGSGWTLAESNGQRGLIPTSYCK